jgi:YVTN family beta-propeller protein
MRQVRFGRVGLTAIIAVLALQWGTPSMASVVTEPLATIDGTTVATVKVGTRPGDEVLDAAISRLFVHDAVTNDISVVDTTTNAVIDTFPAPKGTFALVLDAPRGHLYAISGSQSEGPGAVTILDLVTHEPLASVQLAGEAGTPAFDARRGLLYVPLTTADTGVGTVATVDVIGTRVTKTARVGKYPWAVTLDDAGKRLYVSGEKPARVLVVDTGASRVVATIKVPVSPQFILVDSPHSRVYAVRMGGISVIDTRSNRIVATIKQAITVDGSAPVLDSAARLIYAVDERANAVAIINTRTNKVISRIPLGEEYGQSALLDKAAARLYIANFDEGVGRTVSVVDTKKRVLLGSIPVGKGPQLPLLAPSTSRLYVPNWVSGTVTVIDTTKVP